MLERLNFSELYAKIREKQKNNPDACYADFVNKYPFLRVFISLGNRKTGRIPSVSVSPFVTCSPLLPCWDECYARKHCCMHVQPDNTYTGNTLLYLLFPSEYEQQITTAVSMFRFFRWHVAGEIPDRRYFEMICRVSAAVPTCRHLLFTKKTAIISAYIADGGKIPENLQIICSQWGEYRPENPHNFPVSNIYPKGTECPADGLQCNGNCENCARCGGGCWYLQPGQKVYFEKH